MICHNKIGPLDTELDHIEKLDGLSSQWVSHHHDIITGGFHKNLHNRFGFELYYHKADRACVRGKNKCAHVQFGDGGLEYGQDFEALYFPTCSAGRTIYRWLGKYCLFKSHALYLHDGGGNTQIDLSAVPSEQQIRAT